MAAYIMRAKLEKAGFKNVEVRSCGTIPTKGQPATAEADIAVKKLGYPSLKDHRSQELTQMLVDWSDVIYCMTPNHLQSVRAYKGASSKANMLSKTPIEDPLGESQAVFDKTAKQIEKACEDAIFG